MSDDTKTIILPQEKSRIVLVVDESGSMNPQRQEVLDNINKLIAQQKAFDPPNNSNVMFSFVTFNDTINHRVDTSLDTTIPLTQGDYAPSGRTALYEAIGKTIEKYQNERNVIMVIATDGHENASAKGYNLTKTGEMVKKCKTDLNWKFLYVCEDIDQFKEGENMGLQAGASTTTVRAERGTVAGYMGSECCYKAMDTYRTATSIKLPDYGGISHMK